MAFTNMTLIRQIAASKVRSGFGWPMVGAAILAVVLAGCVGTPTAKETAARQGLQSVGQVYRPNRQRPVLPTLTTNSSLHDFLLYAMLNQPQVEAAYYDWASSIERITRERSLPDPQLIFQTDITDAVKSVMPGLMQSFPGPGKRGLQADVASAESRAKYFVFESAVLRTAFELKRAYYRLYFLDERIRINRETLGLLSDLEKLARAQNEVGKVTLQDVLRAQIEQDRLATDIANLEDSRHPLQAQFKAALGLQDGQPDAAVPVRFESTALDLTSDKLLAEAFQQNPRLKALAAEVERAEASLSLAYKARVPDYTVGAMLDVNAAPVMARPLFGMSLPVWKDKIAAELAEAQLGRQAASARLTAEQIQLTVDFAEKSFAYREITRNLQLLRGKLVPKAKQSLEIARGGYLSGQISSFNLIDTERTLLGFQLSEVEARTQRELILAELSLIVLGTPPAGAPILNDHTQPAPANAQPKP